MSHANNIHDTDPHFTVDPDTRGIIDLSTTNTALMQYDHNSERITFEIPRVIDDHDMSECDRVEVHYINIGTDGKRNAGLYEVDDLALSADDDSFVVCTWLISQNATSLVGSLTFLLRFICTKDGVVEYVWNTAIYSSIPVGNGINNSSTIATQYADILHSWYNELIAASDNGVIKINNATDTAIDVIEAVKDSFIESISKEEIVDEITETALENLYDIETIADVVLDRLPRAEEASF